MSAAPDQLHQARGALQRDVAAAFKRGLEAGLSAQECAQELRGLAALLPFLWALWSWWDGQAR